MKRENFPSQIIGRLQKSVASRCSNPDCRVQTLAAGTEAGSVTSIGEAAHISAASVGGLRFEVSMNAQEKTSFRNALWFCANCHKKVDRDVVAYSATLLHQWKKQAELKAQQELGQKLPSDTDAQNLLLGALGTFPHELSRSAITNVHRAVQQHLESLDPRFSVKTTYDGLVTNHLITAIEPASFKLTVNSKSRADYLSQHENMIDHGKTAVFSTENITVSGSRLLDYVFRGYSNFPGTIVLKPDAIKAVLKLRLLDQINGSIEPFDDMPGEIVAGRKSLTFSGSNCGGTLQMTLSKDFSASEGDGESKFGPNFQAWHGIDICKLPYIDKLAHLFAQLKNLKVLQFVVETNGQELLSGGLLDTDAGRDIADAVISFIDHTKNVGKLATYLNRVINFSAEHVITRDENSKVIEALEIFGSGLIIQKHEMSANPVISVTMGDDSTSASSLFDGAIIEVKMHEDVGAQINAFGQLIDLPPREISIAGATAKVLDGVIEVKPGDRIRIELQPAKNFKYSLRYITQ